MIRIIEDMPRQEFELIKLEAPLLEQRIAQLENLQYRLKQFSITLWVLLLSVGIGTQAQVLPRAFFLAMGILVPTIFLFVDATYAVFAQNIRTRRDRLTEYINYGRDREAVAKFPLLDLTGKSTAQDDPQAQYRKSLIVKLTRTTRSLFYGLQIVTANAVLSAVLAQGDGDISWRYLITAPLTLLLLMILYLLRRIKKTRMLRNLPEGYQKSLDERADGYRLLDYWSRHAESPNVELPHEENKGSDPK